MITVTDKAAAILKDMNREMAGDGQKLRLVVQQSDGVFNIGLLPDTVKDGDEIVENQGDEILIVDSFTSTMLNGARIDVVETPEGEQLAIGPDIW